MSGEMTVRELVERLGRPEIIRACAVSTQHVTNWIAAERIPPARYPTFRDLCAKRGFTPPDKLFFEKNNKNGAANGATEALSTETLPAGSPTDG